MTLADYLVMLRRGWLVLVLAALVGLAAGSAATLVMPATYSAGASVVVTASGDGTAGSLAQGADFAVQRAPTYAALATSDTVLTQVAAVTGDDVEELRSAVSASARLNTSIIDIGASAGTGEGAAERADAVADALAAQATSIDGASASSSAGVEVVLRATAPSEATSPRPRNNSVIGLLIGLVLGVVVVVVVQSLDTRIRNVSDLPRGLDLATATSLPAGRTRPARGLDVRLESFRHLRANLQFGTASGGFIAVAGVTSASDAHGVARQLARVLGEIGLAVVVVDTDLRRRPRGPRNSPAERSSAGLAEVLRGASELDTVLRGGDSENVTALPTGEVDDASAQLLSTAPMGSLLEQLSSRFDYVLLACPPVVERSEAAVVAALSGTCLLVVESGATRRHEVTQAVELLAGVGLNSASVAIDHVRGAPSGRPLAEP